MNSQQERHEHAGLIAGAIVAAKLTGRLCSYPAILEVDGQKMDVMLLGAVIPGTHLDAKPLAIVLDNDLVKALDVDAVTVIEGEVIADGRTERSDGGGDVRG